MKFIISIAVFFLALFYCTEAQNEYRLSAVVVSSGANRSASVAYGNFGIIGEPLVSGQISSTLYKSSLGFIFNESKSQVVPPDPAVLIYPPDNTLLNRLPDNPLVMTFFWMSQTGVTYNIQVSTKENFSTKIIDTTVGNNYLTYGIENEGTLYWRVKVIRGSAEANWSPVWKFSIIVTDVEAGNELQIYPNPVRNIMQIILPVDLNGAKLSLVDLLGKKRLAMNNLTTVNAVNLNGIEQGVYFLIISKGKQRLTRKIIKQ